MTVLALPINIVAGLFGMNVGGVPFSQQPHGLWVMVVPIAVITGIAGYLTLRQHGERDR